MKAYRFRLELPVMLFYKTFQKVGEDTAFIRDRSIRNSAIKIVRVDKCTGRLVGKIKCKVRISLAYSLLSTAIKNSPIIVTIDEDY